MPIYMRLMDIKGDVSAEGSWIRPGLGVLKSRDGGSTWPSSREPGLPGVTVFLDQNNSGGLNRTKVKTYICPSDTSVVQISRISLSPGGRGVEGHDSAAKLKVEQMINSARSQGPNGRLYLATNVGVYQNRAGFDAQGRLLTGTEGGIHRSTKGQNNLHQLGIAFHNSASIEIVVTDTSGRIETGFRIENARVSRHPGGINVCLGDGSVRFISRGVSG